MTNNSVPLVGRHITLAQATKLVGLAGSGGQAKHLVREGNLLVNGVVETRPGRKLFAGDHFSAADADWAITPQQGETDPER